MSDQEYRGYPEVVFITLPNYDINLSLIACFGHILKKRVYDLMYWGEHATFFDDYGQGKIDFDTLAEEVWEKQKVDVVLAGSDLYWHEMTKRWPKTKFISIVRDVDEWKNALKV